MSEQTSPLHDPSAALPAMRATARSLPRPQLGALVKDRAAALTVVALAAILLFGGYLRLSHNNWDTNGNGSSHLHPDERFITSIGVGIRAPDNPWAYFDTDDSKLNPYNLTGPEGRKQGTFVYGTLPLFLNKMLAANTDTLTFGYLDDYNNYDHYNLSGRFLSGMFDLGTVLMVFLLGRLLVNRNVGLLGAFLYAVSAFPIQNAHFFVVDPFVTFFATFTVYFAIRTAKSGGWWNFAIAGAGAGLAAACKITAISLVPVVLLAGGVHIWPSVKPYLAPLWFGSARGYREQQDGRRLDRAIGTLIVGSAIALAATFIAFRVAMPYAFNAPDPADLFTWRVSHLRDMPKDDPAKPQSWLSEQIESVTHIPVVYPDIMNRHWIADQEDQQKLLSGDAAFPPNVQWIGRTKWVWPAQQMIAWGMGPALGITAWLGVAFVAVYAFGRREGVWLVPLSWVLGYFSFMGAQHSLYMRYFLPLYPTLTVFAAVLLHQTLRWSSFDKPFGALGRFGERLAALKPALPYAARAGTGIVVVMTLLMGLAFFNIYGERVTRARASAWIYENVPEGSVVGHEHWDDEVPYGVEGVTQRPYEHVTFNNFNHDSPERVQELLDDLDEVDYIMLSSRRLSGTIPRVPAIWPVTSRYYAALESGELGFRKVSEFVTFPSILGYELDDTGAEESYSVYDHPQVAIYEKTDEYSRDLATEGLHADAFISCGNILPGDAAQNCLLFKPDVLAKQKAGGTWTDIFSPNGVVNDHPVFFWLLAMEVAALAMAPIGFAVFRALPDRGFLLSKPLGILGLSYAAYAPASVGITEYTRPWIAAGLGVMLAAGAIVVVLQRREMLSWARDRWRFLVFCEALFLLTFIGAYLVRIQNPDLWHPSRGGEKPMDLAYLIGVTRTTDLTQGPIDPWHAGGYLNYYWFGQFIGATVTKLTGIVPEVSYNLIVPMYFALAAAATFSLTYNLAESTRRFMRRRPDGKPIGLPGPIVAACGAIFLVLIAGNLKAVDVLQQNFSRVSPWHSDVPLWGGIVVIAGGFWEAAFGEASFRDLVYSYDWWGPSRALTVLEPGREVTPITEWPFWTFLFADLHAHLMAIPFAMTAAAIAFAAVLNFTRLNEAGKLSRELMSWTMVVMLALIIGALRWINSWDYPPFLLLAAAGLVIGERAQDGRITLPGLFRAGVKSAVMLVLTFVLFAPLIANYNTPYGSFGQSEQTTALQDYLSHFGIMLALLAGFGLFQLYRSLSRNRELRSVFFAAARVEPWRAAAVVATLITAGAVIVYFAAQNRSGVTYLSLVSGIAVALMMWREARSRSPVAPAMLFVYSMIGLGLALSGGVEVLTLDGDIGRMNTVFKFYLHVWMLWGVSAAFGLWYVFAVMRPQEAVLAKASVLNETLVRAPRYAFAGVAVLMIALALVYPYFGTRARVHDRFDPSLGASANGMAYMDSAKAVYGDYDDRTGVGGEHVLRYDRDGINWMRMHVQGTPTIIEGHAPLYHYGNRVSIYTGLPGVLGWDWHQSQQRVKFASMVQERLQDINVFYTTDDTQQARDIIRKYDVEWVIVGDVERNYYPKAGIAKFNDGLGGRLELAYTNDTMQIWHVIPAEELVPSTATR